VRLYQDMPPDALLGVFQALVRGAGAGTGQQPLQVLPVEGTFYVVELLDAIARQGDPVPRSNGKDNTGASASKIDNC
jgi:hypothetical protein